MPNASSVGNAIENLSIRGLLVGDRYEWGDDYRGVWGLFGGYDYLSPQIFRVAGSAVSLGTVSQWWLSRHVALQITALGGVGFGAAGTVADQAERDYHYGVMPQALLGLRLIFGERAMLEAAGVATTWSGSARAAGAPRSSSGRPSPAPTWASPYASTAPTRSACSTSCRAATRLSRTWRRHQTIETVSLSYNFLGHTRFGAVEWRGGAAGGR